LRPGVKRGADQKGKEHDMRRIRLPKGPIVLALAVLACTVGIVWAVNPHFIFVRAAIQQDGDLDVSFKEAGLGTNLLINYLATADATVTCTCVTHSGACPQAANKVTFEEQVAEPATFSSGKNGQVNQTITISAPACPASDPPTCGNGQDLRLSVISYTDIALTDTSTPVGPEPAVPSSASATFFTCP
jgi:hypothetical protein